MAQVILFGGGDGGGIIIMANGVRRIPPFDPGLRLELRGVSALTQASMYMRGSQNIQEYDSLVNRLSNHAVGRVEAVVGKLDEENSLIYQDDDGGFICGSTGKPPIPLPHSSPSVPGLGAILSRGVMQPDLLEFVSAANTHKIPLKDVLADPAAVAKRLQFQLSERSVHDLSQLTPANSGKITDPINREIVQFFHKVVDDGRFIDSFASEPVRVSRELAVELSNGALDRLIASGSSLRDPGTVENPVAVAIAVGIVIMLVDDVAMVGVENIVDASGIQKL
jgi:hypothetical protein